MPRPDATPAFITAAQAPYCKPALFVQVGMISGPVHVWSGIGSILGLGAIWQGVGNFGIVSSVEEGSDVQARGIVLTLSGFDPTLITNILTDYRQGLDAIVYCGLFDINTGQLIPNPIMTWKGRTDQPTITVDGPTATLEIACETRLLEMNVAAEFRYTADTQALFYPNDLGFTFVNAIQNQTVYFGRHPASSPGSLSQGS